MAVVDVAAYFTGVDPLAVTKTVIWRPVTTGTALKVGDPVCYCKDAQDYKERGTTPISGGTAYAEGSQNYTGRLFIVEEPLIDNIQQFAGIVAKLGPKAGADGDTIVIYKANSGAVVPANVVLTSTTAGRTLLAVMVGTRTLGAATMDVPDFATTSSADTAGSIDSKIVGVAMETLTAAGLCWVKLDENAFTYQGGQIDQEFVIGPGTVNITVNRSMVKFTNTGGHCQLLHYRALLAGDGTNAGDGQRGVYRFETFLDAPVPEGKFLFGLSSHLEFGADFSLATGGGQTAPLCLTVRTKNTDPDLSNAGYITCMQTEWHLRKTTTGELSNPPTANKMAIFYHNVDSTATHPGNYFIANHPDAMGAYLSTTDAPALATGDIMIPIIIGCVQYYLVGLKDSGV